jgi:hypothetical protein
MVNSISWRSKGKSVYGAQFFSTMTLTAIAPSAQATATLLTADTDLIGTVPSGGAVKLPRAQPGRVVTVINQGANSLTIWPYNTTDAINGGTAGAILVGGLAINTVLLFYCGVLGAWWTK